MDNISAPYFIIFESLLSIFAIIMLVIIVQDREHKWRPWRHKKHHRLHLQLDFHNLKYQFIMANSVTLTDFLPHKGVISVVDQTGTNYSGKLSNIVITSSDATVDSAAVDSGQPNTIDVTAISKTGGATLAFTADFTPDSPIDGQTSFTGLKGTATVVNNVTPQLSLQVNF